MVFVDKSRNALTASPAKYLTIQPGYFLNIESSFRLIIQAAVESVDWTSKTRNTPPNWSDKSRET